MIILFMYFRDEWENGLIVGRAQNLVRDLAECPSNHLTPTAFAEV